VGRGDTLHEGRTVIAIVDYGVGNLFSLCASLKKIGAEAIVTRDPEVLTKADKIILPGVGAFGDAMDKLESTGLVPHIKKLAAEGKPFMGICLGMQLLFDRSFEFGEKQGLGFIKGSVCALADDIPTTLKVPHMGWNALDIVAPDEPLLKYVKQGECVYYVHSFYAKDCDESVAAYSEYSTRVPGIVRQGNVCGCQFHPEKSGETGLNILRAFAEV